MRRPVDFCRRAGAACALTLGLAACGDSTGVGVVNGVTIQPAGETLFPGDTMTFFALNDDGNPIAGVAWSSTTTATATVNASSGLVTAVASGSTLIRATSGGETEDAPVTVQVDPFLDCGVTLLLPGTYPGTLADGDCTFTDDTKVEFYEIRLRQARTVTITLTSATFDPYLLLAARTGVTVLREDDDSGGGTTARIVHLLQPGRYLIAANPFAPGESGTYSLSISVS